MKTFNTSRFLMMIVATGLVFLLSACGMGVKVPDSAPGDPPPDDEPTLHMFEDFSEYDPGDQPEGWTIRTGDDGEYGVAEIIEDPELESERALKMVSNLIAGQNFTAATPGWSTVSSDVTTVGYEFKARVVNSTGVNAYITQSGNHKIVLGLGGGKLTYTEGSGWPELGELAEGWNTIRVIANRDSKTADVYLNGVLVGDDIGFRNETESWTGAYGYILIATSATESKEAYFGDFKAWVVE